MKVKYLLHYVYSWTKIDLVDYESKIYLATNYDKKNYDKWEVEAIQPDGYNTLKVWIKKPKK